MRPRVASSSWLNGKRPADVSIKSTALSHRDAPLAMDDDDNNADNDSSLIIFTQGDGSPVKRPKLQVESTESENGGRSLRSCPDFVHSSGIATSAPIYTEKRATFCCPVVKKQTSYQTPTGGLKIPPQFVIPKCWKVGSWPSRYDRSTRPAGDVPFWSCSEWFCTVHKRLEFGLLNAKINGDTKSLAAPMSTASLGATNFSCGGNSRTTSTTNLETSSHSMGNYMDMDIFEIEPPLPPPSSQAAQQQQQVWNYGRNSSQQLREYEQQQQPQVVPEMFDAPRFILHIINEDDAANKENNLPSQTRKSRFVGYLGRREVYLGLRGHIGGLNKALNRKFSRDSDL